MALVAKAFQDIITFSRASSGTYVNSNGYITNSSVLNYLTYSNQPENAAWTKSNSFVQQNLAINSQDFDLWSLGAGVSVAANSTIAPDGTLTADRITFTAGGSLEFVRRSATLTVGVVYTVSVYAQAAVGTPTFVFDVGNGAATSTAQTPTSAWQRFTFTFTFSGANQWVDLEASAAGTIAFWGAQIVQGSVPGDYRATTSAALPCLYADYTGALRARKFSESSATSPHTFSQGATVASGSTVTLGLKVKAGERTFCALYASTVGKGRFFNLSTGVKGNALIAAPDDSTITSLGGGWYFCTITVVTTTFESLQVYLSTDGTVYNYTGDGSSGIYIADAQLNDGSSALAYYDTTASAYNAPRFDYDPVTLAAKGLLVEESRANLLLQSNDFSNAAWTKTTLTVTAASALSPEGSVNASLLTNTALSGRITQSATATATSHSYSAFTKAGTASTATYLLYNQTTATVIAQGDINLATGVASPSIGTMVSVSAANGWYRATITATTGITIGNTLIVYIYPGGSSGAIGATIYAYGAQLEAGAFATSYIPTVASQVTRAADVASVNTLSPWFNQAGGTIYVEALHGAIPSAAALAVEIGDGTNDNRHAIFTAGSAFASYYVFVGGVSQATISASAFTANAVGKFAAAYAVNDFQTVGNGTLGSSDASGSLPTNLNKMFIGNNIGSTSFWNGWLRRITYYPRRLTNAELQTLTTL